jgi:LytTr DNA-binding domain
MAGGWVVVLAASGVLSILGRAARGLPLDLPSAALEQAPILALWALVTPVVFRWARAWPVRRPSVRGHLVVHAVLGVALVLALNVAIRVPLLAGADGVERFARSLALGLSVYLPGALLAYGALVALGHLPAAGSTGTASPTTTPGPVERIAVRTPTRTYLLPVEEVVRVEADDNYVRIHTPDRSYRTRGSIAAVEAELPANAFVRIHRSHLVRVGRVREVQPLGNGDHVVVMDDGAELRVARGRKAALADALGMPV